MNDPLDYSNVGADLVMDEEERSRRLSNEQIEEINQRAAAQEQEKPIQEESIKPATAEKTQPQETKPQPTGEDTKEEKGYFEGLGQRLSYFGQPLDETNTQVKERLSAPGQGLIDFGVVAINKAASVLMRGLEIPQIPTATKYEDEVATAARTISSVVAPTVFLQGAGMAAGQSAQARVGSKLGGNSLHEIHWC